MDRALSHDELQGRRVLEDDGSSHQGLPARYSKGKFLGKGGFAKCYEITDTDTNMVFAAKIVEKSLIQKPKVQAKLKSEISIHRSLDHDKVVRFYDYFEDSENVYMILELCPNQSLNDMMRKRPNKRLTEQETMFYMYDLVIALKYLRARRVIHRDLKLGNLFLDADVRIKVGDFGLAAQLEHDGDRKRTVCGTPNYIAPEVLEGKSHSYGVDIWSLGVILYTMLVGRPPFETNDVKATYKRIRYNQFSFPDTVSLSSASKDLVRKILQTDPQSRPSLDDILDSPWFQQTRLPPSLPVTIRGYAASPRPMNASARSETPERADNNLARIDSPATRFPFRDRSPSGTPTAGRSSNLILPQGLVLQNKNPSNSGGATPGRYNANVVGRPPLCHRGGNDENAVPSQALDGAMNGNTGTSPSRTAKKAFSATNSTPCEGSARAGHQSPHSCTHQTSEFGMARVAPQTYRAPSLIPSRESSPIDAAMSTGPAKFISSARSTMSSPRQALHSSGRQDAANPGGANFECTATPRRNRSQQSFGQPISSVGPSIINRKPSLLIGDSPRQTVWCDNENLKTPGSAISQAKCEKRQPYASVRSFSQGATPAENELKTRSNEGTGSIDGPTSCRKGSESGTRAFPTCRSSQSLNSPGGANFAPYLSGSDPLSSKLSQNAVQPETLPEVYLTKWVDYSSKYGVGYMLSDGSIGVYFNDSTKIIVVPQGGHFDYITRRTQEHPEVRTNHSMEDYPEDLKKKVTLLRHFTSYMLSDKFVQRDGASLGESVLPKPCPASQKPEANITYEPGRAPYVKKWIRNRHAMMFQLSSRDIHVVFFDKTEVVISFKTRMVTFIDKRSQASAHPLCNIQDVSNAELARRLKYINEILVNVLGARASDLGGA